MEAAVEKEKRTSTRHTKYASRVKLMLSDKILKDFIISRSKKSLKDLRGKISFRDDYDYKLMRS